MNKELMIQTEEMWNHQEIVGQIKKAYGNNLTEIEWNVFMQIGKATKLNPFLREIWAVKYGSSAAQIFIGRDGYRKSAQAHPDYDYHQVDAVYSNDKFEIVDGEIKHNYNLAERGNLLGAYCIVKRKSSARATYVFCELREYFTGKSLWVSKTATMIKKVSEAQALRMSFQALFAGTYSEAEQWEEKVIPAGKSERVRGIEGLKNHLGLHESETMLRALEKLNSAISMEELDSIAELAKDCSIEERNSLRNLYKSRKIEIQNHSNQGA